MLVNDVEENLRSDNSKEDLLKSIFQILEKPSEQRSDTELEVLITFLGKSQFLSKLRTDSKSQNLKKICRCLSYHYQPENEFVFEEGSSGTKFYVILKGKVEVLINQNGSDGLFSHHLKVGLLSENETFGELAIMDKKLKPRVASIRTLVDSHFATLERNDFLDFLWFLKEDINDKISYLSHNPFFSPIISKWTHRALERWAKSFKPQPLMQRSNIVYKEGDPADYIYFISSGEVFNSKIVTLPYVPNIKSDYIFDAKNNIHHQEHPKVYHEVQISVWSECTLFGEEEAYEEHLRDKLKDEEIDKIRKELTKKFLDERDKQEREGMAYKAINNIYLPINPKDDKNEIEKLLKDKVIKLNSSFIKRETTITIKSHHAELWVIERKIFFAHLEENPDAMIEFLKMIRTKKERREERIDSWSNMVSKNQEYLKTQSYSLINNKRYAPKDESDTIIFTGDAEFPDVLKSLRSERDTSRSKSKSPKRGENLKTEPIYTSGSIKNNHPTETDNEILFTNSDQIEEYPEKYEQDRLKKESFILEKTEYKLDDCLNIRGTNIQNTNIVAFQKSRPYKLKLNKYITAGQVVNIDQNKNKLKQNSGKKMPKFIADNPLRGSPFLPNISLEEQISSLETIPNQNYRIANKSFEPVEVLDQKYYLDERIRIKSKIKEIKENISTKYDEKFFTEEDLRMSHHNAIGLCTNVFRPLKPLKKPKKLTSNLLRKQNQSVDISRVPLLKLISNIRGPKDDYEASEPTGERTIDSTTLGASVQLSPRTKDRRLSDNPEYKLDLREFSPSPSPRGDIDKSFQKILGEAQKLKERYHTLGNETPRRKNREQRFKSENFVRLSGIRQFKNLLSISLNSPEKKDIGNQIPQLVELNNTKQSILPNLQKISVKHKPLLVSDSHHFNRKPLKDRAKLIVERIERSTDKYKDGSFYLRSVERKDELKKNKFKTLDN